MIDTITENKNTFAADLLQQLSLAVKIIVKPFPSTFHSISDLPSIRITVTLVLLVIAQLGTNVIKMVNGNKFFDEGSIAVPVFLLLLAYTTDRMCKDFFRRPTYLFKQLFLALVAIYFASVFINGVLTSLALLFDRFQDMVSQLVLLYQVVLTIMAVHAIAIINIWKSAFAVLIGFAIAGLGFVLIGPIIDMLFFYIF